MPLINIDDLCEPIEVRVEGKNYVLKDIPQKTAKRMAKLGKAADDVEIAIKDTTEHLRQAKMAGLPEAIKATSDDLEHLTKQAEDDDSISQLASIMAEVMGADKGEFKELGMRKLTMLVRKVMETIGEEFEGKNVLKVAVTK